MTAQPEDEDAHNGDQQSRSREEDPKVDTGRCGVVGRVRESDRHDQVEKVPAAQSESVVEPAGKGHPSEGVHEWVHAFPPHDQPHAREPAQPE